jgi:hypothetical protein
MTHAWQQRGSSSRRALSRSVPGHVPARAPGTPGTCRLLAGALPRVLDGSGERVLASLHTCTGAPVERLEPADPDPVGHLRATRSVVDVEASLKADRRAR